LTTWSLAFATSKNFSLEIGYHITTDRVRKYIAKRQEGGAANGSINRELSALKRSFSLVMQAGKLFHRPYIPMLEENNARQGFLDHAGFLAFRNKLTDYLKIQSRSYTCPVGDQAK
jgi:Phage integrase, N-terminal SAM-like domain